MSTSQATRYSFAINFSRLFIFSKIKCTHTQTHTLLHTNTAARSYSIDFAEPLRPNCGPADRGEVDEQVRRWVGLKAIGALKNGPDNKSPAINSALKNFTQFEVAVFVIVDAVVLVTTVDFSNNNLRGRPT